MLSELANQKKKRKESIIFIGLMLVLCVGAFFCLSRWERFPRVYSYGDGMRIKPEQVAQAKTNEQGEKKKEKEKQTKQKETPSPQPSQTPASDNQGEEMPESTPKQEKDKNHRKEDPQATSDTEGDENESNDEGEEATEGSNGGEEDNGDGGSNPAVGPEEGQEGEESTGETPNPGETPKPSSTPIPTPTLKPTPTPTAKPTEKPDTVVALQCFWPDKDNVIYGETIPKSTIVVKAEYASGKVVTLKTGEYMITGLKNDSLGEHTMTIIYQGIYYQMDYTVHNVFEAISYDWPTKDKCYYGEEVESEIIVYAHMADGSLETIYNGFTVSGINNKDTSGEQTFTISYGGFSVTGSCRFYDLEYTEVVKCYDGDTLIEEDTKKEVNVDHESEIVSEPKGEVITKGGVEYTLDEMNLVVDGKNKSLPYVIKERDFIITIEKIYRK